MKLAVSRFHHPVTVLGPGRRAGIWVQGCSFGCAGCVSQDTWAADGGRLVDVAAVLAWLDTLCDAGLDGVTISGGEPSEQPDALREICSGIGQLRESGRCDGDVLCYTGCELDELLERCPWAPEYLDAVITGLYQAGAPTDLVWRGSENQQLHPLSERGQRIYDMHRKRRSAQPQMQVSVDDDQVWMIGIPRRGDMQRLESTLRTNGVLLEKVSWRSR